MKKKLNRLTFSIFIIAIIGWMVKDTFTQSGIKDLKGGFTEIASYRNENNTGPVQRIYAVSVKDTTAADLISYGDLMPHSKYGNTKVYFFYADRAIPKKLLPGDENFDAKFNSNCFALYEKSAMGYVGLVKYPFKDSNFSY